MTQPQDPRKRLYTLLALANSEFSKKRAGWEEAHYRMILQQCGATEIDGKISAKTMTIPQLEQALERFKALGFKPRNQRNKNWREPRITKLYAMWCALADADVVKHKSKDSMEAFLARRVAGLNKLEWATSPQLNTAIEVLKAWAKRAEVELND